MILSRRLSEVILLLSFCLVSHAVPFLKVDDGIAITVMNTASAKEQKKAGTALGTKLLAYDSMTGIFITESQDGEAYSITKSNSLAATDKLYNDAGKEVAFTIGIERKKDEKVLPFGYVRIQYISESLDSGSFLFNEKQELAAILYVNDQVKHQQGYAVPISAVMRGWEDFRKNGSISRCWSGLVTTSTSSVPEIVSVRPDSPAAVAGIKKGDILLKVGETSITGYLEAVDAFYYMIADQPIQLSFLRGAELINVSVTPVSRKSLYK